MTRIRVVDDNTVFLDMMQAVLRDQGWDTTALKETTSAFDRLKADQPPPCHLARIAVVSAVRGLSVA